MKKLILLVAFILMSSVASAGILDDIKKLPDLKQGIAFSVIDNKVNYLSTMEVAKWKGFSFEAGTAGDADSTDWKIVGVVSYKVVDLERWGVEFPLSEYIDGNLGVYVGAGDINGHRLMESEVDYGISFSLAKIDF